MSILSSDFIEKSSIPLETLMLDTGDMVEISSFHSGKIFDFIPIIPRTIKKLPVEFVQDPMDYISVFERILPEITDESSYIKDFKNVTDVFIYRNIVDNIAVKITLRDISDEIIKMNYVFVPADELRQMVKITLFIF